MVTCIRRGFIVSEKGVHLCVHEKSLEDLQCCKNGTKRRSLDLSARYYKLGVRDTFVLPENVIRTEFVHTTVDVEGRNYIDVPKRAKNEHFASDIYLPSLTRPTISFHR